MAYDDVPPLLPPADLPAVRTAADLRRAWSLLTGRLGFRDRRLWLLFLDHDGRPSGPLLTLDNLGDGPYDLPVEELVTICREILRGPGGPGGAGSVAMLITRPGHDDWHVGDRAWARYLTAVSQHVGGRVWPVHRAHDGELAAVPLEESRAVVADPTGR